MQLEYHQVDAFSDRPFAGNPAIVYRLDQWLDDALMQQIAGEHNLAETAFVVKEPERWHIRWFTPATEVPLCGHATLAAAYVLFNIYAEPGEVIEFHSLSGLLRVTRVGQRLELDFPAQSIRPDEQLLGAVSAALGVAVEATFVGPELLAVVADEATVRGCLPNLAEVAKLPGMGVIVTAPGQQHDFVSRYFAPSIGIDEDPVTGAIHCSLIPYWSQRLAKLEMRAFQASARGGELHCRLAGDRVKIAGDAILVAKAMLLLEGV
ncbi:PhzF family phenazine biosynthesis protein [Pseudomonas sp. M30-35]|uniref:PhzF family phenazine biosynthesis protein n=1 Tax=Pseudomonas sp. M30-35 TaxID=1981174 RepID=UPI000B3D05DE|nr:PhzF family phenazine biosynthesis protein [Pseudomonas sp. M30-35]ARU87561.1 isomerase [Pseudomonas sp. M30-35]